MTREKQIFEESKIYSKYVNNQTDFEYGFINGAKWADENPHSQYIAEYLYKEKGYPISLNGEIPTFEETMKDVQTYNEYKSKQWLEKACSWLREQKEMIGISFQEDFIERFKMAMKTDHENSSELVNKQSANVWHNASEEPKCKRLLIIYRDDIGCIPIDTLIYNGDADCHWKELVKRYNIIYWAYAKDILPKGGDEDGN